MKKFMNEALGKLCALLVEMGLLEDAFADSSDRLLHAKSKVYHQGQVIADIHAALNKADDPKRKATLQARLKEHEMRLEAYKIEQKAAEMEFSQHKSSKTTISKHQSVGAVATVPGHHPRSTKP